MVARRPVQPAPTTGSLTHNNQSNQPPKEPGDLPAVGDKMPPSIGLCADEYSAVRALRLAMENMTKAVKARETEIQEHIINNLSKSSDTGASGLKYRAQIVMKDTVNIEDWSLLTGYILENDRFDLVQKRLGETAAMDLIADGVDIPGVRKMKIPKVSITKI